MGCLKASELQRGTELWIRNVQQRAFSQEFEILKSGTSTSKAPRIRQLRLFVDTNDLIRCNERIHNAVLPDTAKFPYILPNDHYLSKLIVLDAHDSISHSGVNATTAYVKQTYWIPAIPQLVRKTLRKCVTCKKEIGKPYSAPDQPPLPKLRLQQAPPFTTTGIDFTGALHVRGTNSELTKAYICLFTCVSTRAIHLEVVPNLSEETFLQAFRRFFSRKSTPRTVITDNAKTFESASEEIKRLCESEKLHETFIKQGIDWNFIPKRAPWFKRWSERLIGLTKTSLKKILGKSLVDLETLQTIVTEIECVLNDRPLTHISSDPKYLEPLTPSHLLYGRTLKTLPYPATRDIDIYNETLIDKDCLQKRVKRQCLLIEQFWNRWKTEYLTALRETHTNRKNGKNSIGIKIGDLVQIHDDNKRKILWKTGIVDKLNYGHDGLVRSAIIRTKTGTTSRPIVKLYPLEINADIENTDNEDKIQSNEETKMPHRQAALRAKEMIKEWTI